MNYYDQGTYLNGIETGLDTLNKVKAAYISKINGKIDKAKQAPVTETNTLAMKSVKTGVLGASNDRILAVKRMIAVLASMDLTPTQVFDVLDSNHDGFLDVSEIGKFFTTLKVADVDCIKQLFKDNDKKLTRE